MSEKWRQLIAAVGIGIALGNLLRLAGEAVAWEVRRRRQERVPPVIEPDEERG